MSLPAEIQSKLESFLKGKSNADLFKIAHNLANSHKEQITSQARWQTEDYQNMKSLHNNKAGSFKADCEKMIATIDASGSNSAQNEINDLK